MTTFAGFAFLATVRIVESMAGETRGPNLLLKQQTAMAIFTGDLFVSATQMEIGIFVMFKFGPVPALNRMALLAILAVLTFMLVAGFMARKAIGL